MGDAQIESNFPIYKLLKALQSSMAKNMHREKDKQMEPRIYYDPISFFFLFPKMDKKIDSGWIITNSQKQKVSMTETSIDDDYWSDLVFLKKIHLVFKIIFVVRIIITIESLAIWVCQIIN